MVIFSPRVCSIFWHLGRITVVFFALFGFALTSVFFAVRFGFTNVPGAIDLHDRQFSSLYRDAAVPMNSFDEYPWCAASALAQTHPIDGYGIFQFLLSGGDADTARRMIAAVLLRGSIDTFTRSAITTCKTSPKHSYSSRVFPWMNTIEWTTLAQAISKDSETINRAARASGVPARLIVAQLIAEQMRLFTSDRTLFKAIFSPLKILGNETQFSLGVTGIKEETAKQIERNAFDSASQFYGGVAYEHVLRFETDNPDTERIQRLTNPRDHYYSYLYTGLYLQQIIQQWKRAGYDISDRPEILSTLFNIGFSHSLPNPNPRVGGATIDINGASHTFGSLAYDFYYSGELQSLFPL
ncbi:MAG: hypothetical protein RIQ54_595 [Candidatus Parcubacteria bacterium]|jgi:hypothetical protein